ncbi:Hypothetical protein SMAX5B_018892, partial [Scophthalmus maximus]
MLQGSVHNSWKLKTSQFLHGQHTHRTSHPLSMFGMLWIGVYDSVFQSCLLDFDHYKNSDLKMAVHRQLSSNLTELERILREENPQIRVGQSLSGHTPEDSRPRQLPK